MNLIVAPPKVKDFTIPKKTVVEKAEVFLAGCPAQAKYFVKKPWATTITETYPLSQKELLSVGQRAEFFAQNWFKQGDCSDLLSYRGINTGDVCYLVILNFIIIKALRAILVSEKLINDNLDKKFFLINDKSFWSKAFLEVAKNKHPRVEVLTGGIKRFKKRIGEEDLKWVIKKVVSKFMRFKDTDLKKEKIIYSCALRFAKDIWGELSPDHSICYLRPIFSFSARKIEKNSQGLDIRHILPDYFVSYRKRKEIAGKIDVDKISDGLRNCFSQRRFFDYNGYDLWPVIGDEVVQLIKENLIKYATWIHSFEHMLDALKPELIIIDEDDCPFNRALIRTANLKKVKSIQLIHGLAANSLSESATISTKVAVPGVITYRRLIEFGVEKEKVEITGLPHYEQKLKHIDIEAVRQKLCSRLGLHGGETIVTLATQPFYGDDSPYLGHLYSPELIERMVRFTIRAIKKIEGVRLVIKLHPCDANEWFTRDIVKDEGGREKLSVLKKYDILELLASSSLLLTAGSTVYLEGLLLNIPVLLFDDSNARSLDYMSPDYLDINDEEASVLAIRKIIHGGPEKESRLAAQKEELKSHFLDCNKGALSNLKQIMENMKKRSLNECGVFS